MLTKDVSFPGVGIDSNPKEGGGREPSSDSVLEIPNILIREILN